MHILVQTITGASCEISNAETLSEIQSQIESQMGIQASEQKLLMNGKLLTAESTIEDNSTISLVISLEGGAKGKKKKKDTKKTKKKHHKKKVKLQVLGYYKVEDDKVIRLKQMCKVCPPGTFIADHADRLYCGRCRTVYNKVSEGAGKQAKGGKKEKGGKKK